MTNLISKAFEGHNIRIITDQQGEPWFVAADIAKALGYTDADQAIRRHCKGATKAPVEPTGGMQRASIIPERDVYRLVMRSKLESAERFEEWVVGEVLPSIRKHGGYIAGQEQDAPELIMAKALMVAQSVIDRKSQELAAAQQTIAANAHKSEFFDNYAYSGGALSFRAVAKLLKANERHLRQLLLDGHVMYRLNGVMTPYQNHIDAGRFELKTGTSERNNHAFAQARFTPKGVQWIAGLWASRSMQEAA